MSSQVQSWMQSMHLNHLKEGCNAGEQHGGTALISRSRGDGLILSCIAALAGLTSEVDRTSRFEASLAQSAMPKGSKHRLTQRRG